MTSSKKVFVANRRIFFSSTLLSPLTFIRSRWRQIAALFEKSGASLILDSLWAAGMVVFSSYTMSRQMAAHPAHCAMLLPLSLVLK